MRTRLPALALAGALLSGAFAEATTAEGTWTTGAPMPTARYRVAAAAIDGKVYVVGGNGVSGISLNTLEVYDPATNTWATGTPMPTARGDLAAAAVNGKLYVVGGAKFDGLNTLEIYDPTTDGWTTGAPMPTARGYLAAAAIGEGASARLYAVGGTGDGAKKLEIYDPATDTWTTGAPMPTARSALATAAIGEGASARLYAVGGCNGNVGGDVLNVLEVYDPATNTWTSGPAMPTGRSEFAAAAIDGKLYAVGGYDGSTLNTLEIYTPTPTGSQVSGTITTTTWAKANSPYHVTGTLTVPGGNTLTIEPGVDVLFDADVALTIEGRLAAIGTKADSIRFLTSAVNDSGEWRGIRINGSDSSTIAYARISGGRADNTTLGREAEGGGVFLDLNARLGLSHVVIRGNAAVDGGGAYMYGWFTADDCIFQGNTATRYLGGGLRIIAGGGRLTDCEIVDNAASSDGGGIFLERPMGGLVVERCVIARNVCSKGFGSGVFADADSLVSFTNCTVTGNRGPGLGGRGGAWITGDGVTLRNSIVWGNGNYDVYVALGATAAVTYSDVGVSVNLNPGTGCISADPLFANSGLADYHLRPGSPCIDAGDPASPLDPDGTRADMGAFPFEHPSNRPPVWSSRPDVTGDEAALISFTVSATDPDGGTLTYAAPTLPSGATFAPATRTFSWTPGYAFVPWNVASRDTLAMFSVTDGTATVLDTVRITVRNRNRPPVWSSRPDVTGDEGALISFTVSATDPDGGTLSYAAPTLPAGATFTPATRTFAWTPSYAQAGAHQAIFSATDGEATVLDTVGITVRNTNRPPVWSPRPDVAGDEGAVISFTVLASDPDGGTLTYAAPTLPSGATFAPETRTFAWTPSYAQAGAHQAIFSATDGEATARDTVVITVANVDRPPSFTGAPGNVGQTIDEGQGLTAVVASDPDGDVVTYSLAGGALPAGITLKANGTFSGVATVTSSGPYAATIRATSGGLYAETTLAITVRDVNWPPVWTRTPDGSTPENQLISFAVSATDPDGGALVYSAPTLPVGATFVPATRTFSWTPTYDQAGIHRAIFSVTDGAATVRDTVEITVTNVNRAPAWLPLVGNPSADGRTVSFTLAASDPDRQALTYRALTLPRGATFTAATGVFLWTRSAWQPADTVAVFGASDGDTTVTRTVALHAATANQPPALAWAGAPPDTVSWDAPLAVSVADAEGDPVRIGSTISTDGGVHWSPMAASGDTGLAAAPRAASVTWRTAGQLPGRSLATARVRLVPSDMDVGAPLERDVRVLNLPCDWDGDGRIGLADFATLRQAWQTQDTTKNIGPYRVAAGDALPNILRTQDRRIDFDDLMAFALLWDWAAGRSRVRSTARIAAERPTGPAGADLVTLRPVEGPTPAVEIVATPGLTGGVLGVALVVPPEIARTARLERGAWVGADGWWLVRADTVAGVVEAWVARGSDASGDVVAMLRLPPGMERLSMHVTYEALSGPGDVPLVGSFSREVGLVPLPGRWALAAAPNPFNPATTIRYEVPTAAQVRLMVYDVLGRKVVALVDERREPGRYAVTWDGRDAAGRSVASGVYVVRLETEGARVVRRVVMVR